MGFSGNELKGGVGCIDGLMSLSGQAKAEISIMVVSRKSTIKPSYGFKLVFGNHETVCGNRAAVAHQIDVHHAVDRTQRQILSQMRQQSPMIQDHPAMRNPAVGAQELQSHGADLFSLCLFQ